MNLNKSSSSFLNFQVCHFSLNMGRNTKDALQKEKEKSFQIGLESTDS